MNKIRGTVWGKEGTHLFEITNFFCPVCHELMEVANDGTYKNLEDYDFFFEKSGRDKILAARRTEENYHVTLRCPECRTELNTDIDVVEIITE